MRSVLIYTLARLALFAATAGVLYEAGARGFLLLALSVLISGVISYVLLARQRDRVSASVSGGAARMRRGLAEGAAREDDDTEPAAGPPHENDEAAERPAREDTAAERTSGPARVDGAAERTSGVARGDGGAAERDEG